MRQGASIMKRNCRSKMADPEAPEIPIKRLWTYGDPVGITPRSRRTFLESKRDWARQSKFDSHVVRVPRSPAAREVCLPSVSTTAWHLTASNARKHLLFAMSSMGDPSRTAMPKVARKKSFLLFVDLSHRGFKPARKIHVNAMLHPPST